MRRPLKDKSPPRRLSIRRKDADCFKIEMLTSPTAEALIDVGVVGDIPIVINVGPGAAAPQTGATSVVPVALAVAVEVEVEIFEDVGGLRWFYAAATTAADNEALPEMVVVDMAVGEIAQVTGDPIACVEGAQIEATMAHVTANLKEIVAVFVAIVAGWTVGSVTMVGGTVMMGDEMGVEEKAGEDAPRHDGKSVHQVGVVEVVLMTEDPEVQILDRVAGDV